MDNIGSIIIVVALVVVMLVLFFIADYMMRDKKKKETKGKAEPKKDQKPKEPVHEKDAGMEEPNAEDKETTGIYNLSNDIEKLIEGDKKNDSHGKEVIRASNRSRLANHSRMREYYERRHKGYENKFSGYGVQNDEDNEEQTKEGDLKIGDTTLSADEVRKLVALSEIIKTKNNK